MANGFPNFPKKGDYVRFSRNYEVVSSWSAPLVGASGVTGTSSYSTAYTIITGTIGEILETAVDSGYDMDLAQGYVVYIGIMPENSTAYILKLDYTKHPGLLDIIPNTPASKVLYGKKDEEKI